MKCIKAIKSTKNVMLGSILRTNDKDADIKVKDGYWKYVPKSEWKSFSNDNHNDTKEKDSTNQEVNNTKKKTSKKS